MYIDYYPWSHWYVRMNEVKLRVYFTSFCPHLFVSYSIHPLWFPNIAYVLLGKAIGLLLNAGL